MSPMTPPRNLVVTKVHVTDKPYEVQLGAIRWIKTLVSTLVDTALATAVPVPAPLAPLVAPVDTAVDDPGDCSEDSLEETTTSTPKKDAPAGSVACADPSWDLSVEYQREEGGAPSLSLLGATNTTACSAALSTSAENSRASEQKRRKRPRTATQLGQDLYDVGAIVECFHADDGLWYPAKITAIAPDTTVGDASNATTMAQKAYSTPSDPLDGSEGGEQESAVSMCMEVEGERKADNDTPVPTTTQDHPVPAGSEESEHAHLDVTFLGYGNLARVPVGWVKQLSSPEVLHWCVENGFVEETVVVSPTSTLDEDGGLSVAGLLSTATPAADGKEALEDAKEDGSKKKGKNRRRQRQNNKQGKGKNKNNRCKQQQNNKQGKGKTKKKGVGCGGGDRKREGTLEGDPMVLDEKIIKKWGPRCRSPYPQVPNKYWGQRYRYFSRFDEGVSMDKEGWYSVTPEAIARHIAERVCCDVVVDPFVGCGGNAVQFALVCHLVIAIDLDPVKLEHARRNAIIYGVENRIEFILGDAMKVLPTLKADAVFLSPPWGGPSYQDSKTFDLHTMIPKPLTALEMFRAARAVTPNVVFFLPRNVDVKQVAELPASLTIAKGVGGAQESENEGDSKGERCELEQQFLNGKLKTVAAYFGEDIVVADDNNESSPLPQGPATKGVSPASHGAIEERHSGSETRVGEHRAPAWGGYHVRFSDDEGSTDPEEETPRRGPSYTRMVEEAKKGKGFAELVSGAHDDLRNASSSRQRENAIYQLWVDAAAATGSSID